MKKTAVFVLFLLLLSTLAFAMGEKPKGAPIVFETGEPAVIKLGADWCSPCRAMKPIIKELKAELKGKVIVMDLNIEEHRELAKKYKVRVIPTTVFIDGKGNTVAVETGFMDKAEILSKLKELGLLK